MLEAISPEAAAQVIGGHNGDGVKVKVGFKVTVGVGSSGLTIAAGPSVGVSHTSALHKPKPKPAPDWVAPKRRRQTDHANEIQGPTGRQRSK